MSLMQEQYSYQVELQPLAFDETVAHYITLFCKRQGYASPERIIETLQMSPELQDLAQRPLLLLMILEVLVSSGEVLHGPHTRQEPAPARVRSSHP